MEREQVLRWIRRLPLLLDRVAAGRQAGHRIDDRLLTDLRTRASFTRVTWLLASAAVIGAVAVGEAVRLARHGHPSSAVVWWRLLVVLAIVATLFYFAWRARLGFWWAYSRLRMFSLVFPVVAASSCLVPGLYPDWMIAEQLLFSGVLLLIRAELSAPHLRAAYVRPARAAR